MTAATRAECVVRLQAALENFTVEGLTTNLPLLRYIAAHPDFIENRLNTRWLEQTLLPAFSATQE